MKKRIISLALALVLTLALAAPAFAEEEPAADAAPTQRIKEIHYTFYNYISGGTSENTDVYSYDKGGVLPSSMTSNNREHIFTYDDAGRILTGEGFTCTYDENGRLAKMEVDHEGVYSYRYDEEDQLQGYTLEYSDGTTEEKEYEYICEFDEEGRVIKDNWENREYAYAPQLRVGYCSADVEDRITQEYGSFDLDRDLWYTYFQLDVLDAAGTPIQYHDIVPGWIPPIDMTYDDAGYLTHMESSNGYTADFTYEPVA